MEKECKKHGFVEHFKIKNGTHKCSKCASEAVQKRREKLKQMSVVYKGGKCEICGYNKCVGALEFHHVNPNDKEFGISANGYTMSWDKVKIELDKCILICANCHREQHYQLNNFNTEDIEKILKTEGVKKEYLCCDCGITLNCNKAKRCIKCSNLDRRKIERVSKEELLVLIRSYSFNKVGKMFNVSDNTIRQWCKDYDLPYKRNDINKLPF